LPYYWKCPDCGYVAPVAWVTSRFDMEREIADLHEFRQAYPDLAKKLELEQDIEYEGFVYRVGKQNRGMVATKVMRLGAAVFRARGQFYPPKGYFDSLCHRWRGVRPRRMGEQLD